jgi:hypothetical protein
MTLLRSVKERVGDPVPEKTIGKRPWVPVGGPRGVGIVGVLSKESRVNHGSGEVVVSTPSQQWFTNRRSTQNYGLASARCQSHPEMGCEYKSPMGALQSLAPLRQTQPSHTTATMRFPKHPDSGRLADPQNLTLE